jgi:hypothetical protein
VLKKPRSVRFVTVMAFVLPGSGQVFNGAPYRGVIMQFGMVFGAFITYMLTTPDISPIGRMSGGLLVYVFSIVDANGIAKLRVKAWERIEAGEPPRPRRGMANQAPAKANASGSRKKKGGAAPPGKKRRPAGRTRDAAATAGSGTGRGEPASSTQQEGGPAESADHAGPESPSS